MKPDRATKGKAAPRPQANAPWVAVIMGSKSDLRFMQPAIDLLAELRIPHEARVVSAHRTPDWMFEYAATAESRGLEVIIYSACGVDHLHGMLSHVKLLSVHVM